MTSSTANSFWGRVTLFFMGTALVASGAATWSGMQGTLASSGLLPHGVCYVWNPALIGLHLTSDTLIGLAYFSIPVTLVYLLRKRHDVPFNWMFLLFGLFIIACGATHWMEVWTLWSPSYWLAGTIKAITAAASVPTAIALVMLIPQILSIPSTQQLEAAKAVLEAEVLERKRIESELLKAQATLEVRVVERTRELAAATEEARLAHQAIKEANQRKDRFLAILSHELRNPLNPVRNAVAIMRQPNVDVKQLELAREVIERQVSHMARLLEDLLDVSRITQDRVSLMREHIGVASAINAAIETSRPLIEAARQQLSVSLPNEPVLVDADPTRLAQMLSNLLHNACKYTDAGGSISLTVACESGNAVIRVRDNGIGIEPRDLPGLFELFSQIDSTRNRSVNGLGIGLALVKSLAQLHGGSVEAKSEGIGTGAEFILRLPLVQAGLIQAGPAATEALANTKRPLRVLVVDDNPDSAETLSVLLKMIGHDVRQANDATSALAIAATFRPHVGIVDIGMPGIDGYELARMLRREPWGKQTRLIALTGWGNYEDKQQAADAGFYLHFTKPVDLRTLEEELGKVQIRNEG